MMVYGALECRNSSLPQKSNQTNTKRCYPERVTARSCCLLMVYWWAGWGSNRRSDTPYTLLLPRRIATYRGT